MAYKITFTKRFVKNVKRLSAAERAQLKKKLELLMQDPLYPSLRTKRIQGTTDLFEFSVNMDVRVIWQYDGDTIILLLDIGHHDILNQFYEKHEHSGRKAGVLVLFVCLQRRRPPPAADTGRSCWGSGQQDASGSEADAGSRNPCSPAARPYKTTAGLNKSAVVLLRGAW